MKIPRTTTQRVKVQLLKYQSVIKSSIHYRFFKKRNATDM